MSRQQRRQAARHAQRNPHVGLDGLAESALNNAYIAWKSPETNITVSYSSDGFRIEKVPEKFLDFTYHCDDRSGQPLLGLVKDCLEEIKANWKTMLDVKTIMGLSMVAGVGWQATIWRLGGDSPSGSSEKTIFLLKSLGQHVFERLPPSVWTKFFPFHDVSIGVGRSLPDYRDGDHKKIVVHVRSMSRLKTPDGTAFYSRKPRIISTPEGDLRIAFRRHAAERLCTRTNYDWKTYGGMGDSYAKLNDCLYSERCFLPDGAEAFVVVDSATAGFPQREYASILDETLNEHPEVMLRIGYCPADRYQGFLIGRTLLMPGMRNTPEHAWAKTNLSKHGLYELEHAVEELNCFNEQGSTDFSKLYGLMRAYLTALKPIHAAGGSLWQTRLFEGELFDYSDPEGG